MNAKFNKFLILVYGWIFAFQADAAQINCTSWLNMLAASTNPVRDMTAANVFKGNFERILAQIDGSSEPFTIVVPAKTRTGKTSILYGLKDQWIKEKNGIALILNFQRDPGGKKPVYNILYGALRDAEFPGEVAD